MDRIPVSVNHPHAAVSASRTEVLQGGGRHRRPPTRKFIEAALARDFIRTNALSLSYFAATRSRIRVFVDLFHASQQHMEERWHLGIATADEEYRVHVAIEKGIDALADIPSRPLSTSRPAILLATLSPEAHDTGVRVVAASLDEAGWRVDLRTRISRDELLSAAAQGRHRIVGISATYLSSRSRAILEAAVASLRRAGTSVIAGGGVFNRSPLLGEQLAIDAVAADASFAVLYANRLKRMLGLRSYPDWSIAAS